MVKSRTIIATPPGVTIKEQLSDRGMSQKEFSTRMELTEKHISRLINGEVRLTTDVANRLEMVLGIPANIWNNLEAIYQEKLFKAEQENMMDEDIEIARKLPYKEMVKNGWIKEETNKPEKVITLRKFFEVVRLGCIESQLINKIACRKLAETERSDYALIAWAQKAKLEARKINVKVINVEKLKSSLNNIRAMTRKLPEEFCPELRKVLSDCGIAIVFLPHIGGSFLHGATFYDGKKIVMGLTVRGKDADKFWFSLFHEIAHIIHGDIGKSEGLSDADEKQADIFSKNILIPEKLYEDYVHIGCFSKEGIMRFANKIGIDAGIVVGRLQKDNFIQYNWHNELKCKYQIS